MMSLTRNNKSTQAEIELSKIFASGTFKNVWAGEYTSGERRGQKCVAKEFKSGSVYEDRYFEEEINVIYHAQGVIDRFHSAKIIDQKILLNNPEIWEYTTNNKQKILVEPMIEKFEKFNSNTGWAPISGGIWVEAMQALSHFSYHDSGKQFVLCDIQGGAYSDGFVLSDPVIMSHNQFCGPLDLGTDGINDFFRHHRCGRYCKKEWAKPIIVGLAVYPMREGSTMTDQMPICDYRKSLSKILE